jgi:hypothetical protein
MHRARFPALALVACLGATLSSCTDRTEADPASPIDADAARSDSAAPSADASYRLHDWPLPTPDGAAQPDLVAAPDGSLLLSWIEPAGEGRHALRFARYADNAWSEPRTIATGGDWFVNWADTPHIAATADGALWAHWLQKSAAATYAYDVALARSGDGGATWSDPVLVNDDGTPTEHGFVSLWPDGDDGIGIAWLDGRHMHGDGAHTGHGGGEAMMTLRSARFDATLARHDERELDASVCDCCQTDSALTDHGRLLVYRDRTADEVRDIQVTREDGEGWTTPRRVHADDWTMPACPVNGPAVAARGSDAIVGWYTAAGGTPRVLVARSTDAGDSFAAPLELDAGAHVQGRIAVALGADAAWALWTREDRDGQTLQLARLAPDLSRELQRIEVARLEGRGRATGFPQLALVDGQPFVAWTDVIDKEPRLQAAGITR